MPPAETSSPPHARAGSFAGPLDLLLEEVRSQKVAIEEVAMAPLVANFLAYMRAAARRNIDLDIEWLHWAATLIHWKSLSLLPREPGSAPGDPLRDTLIEQLLAHRREVSAELDRRRTLEQGRFSRAAETPVPASGRRDVTVWDLLQQARELRDWCQGRRSEVRALPEPLVVEPDDVTVEEMCEHLRQRMAGCTRAEGSALLVEVLNPGRRAVLFLGLLEMARVGEVEVLQEEGFGPFWITRRYGPKVGMND